MSQHYANSAPQSNEMDGIEIQLSQVTTNAQDPVEYTTTHTISEAALAINWICIFGHYYPTQMHVLTPYRESDRRVISFIRTWFAFTELNNFMHLDAVASDPNIGELYASMINDISSAAEPEINIKYPDMNHASFEDWYHEIAKPKGGICDEEAHRLVAHTFWLSHNNSVTQTVDQGMHTRDARSEDHNEEATQRDADLSSHLEHMQIDDMMLE